MSATDTTLPPGFQALEPFVAAWAVENANARLLARLASGEADRVAFFEVGRPLLAQGLAYLDQTDPARFDAAQKRLMRLLLSLAHVALAVEVQGDDEPRHARDAHAFTITRAPADL